MRWVRGNALTPLENQAVSLRKSVTASSNRFHEIVTPHDRYAVVSCVNSTLLSPNSTHWLPISPHFVEFRHSLERRDILSVRVRENGLWRADCVPRRLAESKS
jgi:hypothetical protein